MACSSTEALWVLVKQLTDRTYNFSVVNIGLNPVHATNIWFERFSKVVGRTTM